MGAHPVAVETREDVVSGARTKRPHSPGPGPTGKARRRDRQVENFLDIGCLLDRPDLVGISPPEYRLESPHAPQQSSGTSTVSRMMRAMVCALGMGCRTGDCL
jgi:hypothetical protein